jgi:hypothetical protein
MPNGVGGFSCQCLSSYTGQRCEDRECLVVCLCVDDMERQRVVVVVVEVVDPCASQPCSNGGTCQPVTGITFQCICPLGSSGTRCEVLDPCLTNPCLNGATCESVLDGFRCVCPAEFTGARCETRKLDLDRSELGS